MIRAVLLPFVISLCFAFTLGAQTATKQLKEIATPFESADWLYIKEDAGISADQFVKKYAGDFGLTQNDEMRLESAKADDLGMTHHTYQQLHRDVPVEFAVYKVHSREGIVRKANGVLAQNLDVDTDPALSEDEALQIALECIGAHTYNWQIPELEDMMKNVTGDPEATFFPRGQLLIADRDFDPSNAPKYNLAWKFEIHSADPSERNWVYVDAFDGSILKELDLHMHENGYVGTAETRYSGTVQIITDSTESGFVLRDPSRGRGIETYDAQDTFTVDVAVDFTDDDNYWDNSNVRADNAATNCHYASEQLYDYLRDVHGFDSYDNKGSKMISYVHYGENWFNASWNGFWGQYGDASGEPWVNADVVGHEYAHGFTWATSALIYSRESGALNESFSDILGEALEYYINDGVNDWLATPSPIDTIRDYANPENYGDPSTYLDENWVTTPGDNFGVHSNSGVGNKFFYLLVNGGQGVNSNGDEYAVNGIGMEAAMDIIFRSMTTYLFPTAQYADGRQSSLYSAEDLYGSCSEEYKQVANAWHAVGVGERVEEDDFTVTSIEQYPFCGLGDEEQLTINLKHMGCDSSSPVAIEARVIKSNPPLSYVEMIEIPEGVGPGETFSYTFQEPFSFARTGEHTIQINLSSETDSNKGNDVSEQVSVFQLRPIEEHEFRFYTNIAIRTFRDTMAFFNEEFAQVRVLNNIGPDSSAAILIEGDRMRYANPVLEGEDLFDVNERLGTRICMCMDATNLDSMGLQFDLRQTFSNRFEERVEIPQPKTSALRVVVDDTEVARYFPETNNDDEWTTHNIDLEDYLGLEFTLCFETRTIQSIAADVDSIGDRVFIDNILVKSVELSSSTNFDIATESLDIFPNPALNVANIDFLSEVSGMSFLRVIDMNGAEIYREEQPVIAGQNRIPLNTASWGAGVYVVEIIMDDRRFIGRVAVL